MLHRVKKKNDLNRDKWIGIGGGFLEDESPEECMRRETLEETGLTLNSMRFRAVVTFVIENGECEHMFLFTSDDFSGELTDCDEGIPEWVPKDKVKTLDLWEGDLIFLKMIEENAPFFTLKLEYDRNGRLTAAVLNGEEKIR